MDHKTPAVGGTVTPGQRDKITSTSPTVPMTRLCAGQVSKVERSLWLYATAINHHTRHIAGVFHKEKILHNHDHCNAKKNLRVKFLPLSRLSTWSFFRGSIQLQKLHSLSE